MAATAAESGVEKRRSRNLPVRTVAHGLRFKLLVGALMLAFVGLLLTRASEAKADPAYQLGYVGMLLDGWMQDTNPADYENDRTALTQDIVRSVDGGASWVRLGASWCNEEPLSPRVTSDPWDQAIIDRVHEMIGIAHQHNLKVLLQVSGHTPAWATSNLFNTCRTASLDDKPWFGFPPTVPSDHWNGASGPEQTRDHTVDFQNWIKKLLIEEPGHSLTRAQQPDAIEIWNEPNLAKYFGRDPNNPTQGMPYNLYSARIFEPALKAVRSLQAPMGSIPVLGPSASSSGPHLAQFTKDFVPYAMSRLQTYDSAFGTNLAHSWRLSQHLYPKFVSANSNFDVTRQDLQEIHAFGEAKSIATNWSLGKIWIDEWGINARHAGKDVKTLPNNTQVTTNFPSIGFAGQANQMVTTFCWIAPQAGPMITYTTIEDKPGLDGYDNPYSNESHPASWGYATKVWEYDPSYPGNTNKMNEVPTQAYATLRDTAYNPTQNC